jgi:hypothetical protein
VQVTLIDADIVNVLVDIDALGYPTLKQSTTPAYADGNCDGIESDTKIKGRMTSNLLNFFTLKSFRTTSICQ